MEMIALLRRKKKSLRKMEITALLRIQNKRLNKNISRLKEKNILPYKKK